MSVRDDLELDVSNALAEVDRIAATLDRVTSEFKVDLADALSVLRAVQTVTLEADTSDLTREVDAAIEAGDTVVEVNGETRNLTQEVTAAVDAADSQVILSADAGEITGDINAAIDAADTEISVSTEISGELVAEAAAAAASVDGVTESAQNAEGAIEVLGSRGSLSLGKLGTAAAALVSAGLLVKFFADAIEGATNLAESQSKVDAVFQDSVGTINEFASTSAEELGLANAQALEFAGTFGNLFTALGLTREEAAKLSPEVVQLGADLASFNNLAVPDALEKLRSGLVGEIEPLRSIGISFNAAQVEAKALELGLAGVNGEISEGAKVQARWALIQEQSTNAQGDFARTSEGLANQLRILQGELGNAAAEAGEQFLPTLLELIDMARDLIPTVAPIADVFSTALLAIAPLLETLATSAAPLLADIGGAIGRVFIEAIPVVEEIANVVDTLLGPALETSGPLIDDLADSAVGLVKSLLPFVEVGTELAQILGPVLAFSLQSTVAGLTLVIDAVTALVETLGPVASAFSPIVLLGEAFGFLGGEIEDASGAANQYSALSSNIIRNADDLAAAIQKDVDAFDDYVFTQSEFSKAGPDVVAQLRRTGVEMEDLRLMLGGGEQGFKDFVAAAIDAGQVRITVDGVDQTAEDIRNLDGSVTDYLNTSEAVVERGGALTEAFIAQTNAVQEQTRVEFEAIVAMQGLTDEQIRQIGVQAQQTFGVDTYTTRLQILAQQQAANAEQEAAATARLEGNAAAWVALTEAIANGTINVDNAGVAAELLGIDMQTATAFINDAKGAVDAFVNDAIAKFPTVTTVFEDLKKSTNPLDPASLANNLNAATLAGLGFQQNIDTIAERFPEVAKLLQEQGPEAAAAFAQTFLASSDEVKQGLEEAIIANENALGAISDDIRASIGSNAATATELAEALTGAYDENLKFDEVTRSSIDEAGQVFKDSGVIDPAKAAANESGKGIGEELSLGIALGMASGFPLIEQYARDAVTRAEEAARAEAQSESPSRLFADLGSDLTAGLAEGMGAGSSDVVKEAERIVQEAADVIGGTTLSTPAFEVPVAARGIGGPPTTIVDIGGVQVQVQGVPGMTDAELKHQGAMIYRGIMDELPAEARIA